jgi:hypothetical protein
MGDWRPRPNRSQSRTRSFRMCSITRARTSCSARGRSPTNSAWLSDWIRLDATMTSSLRTRWHTKGIWLNWWIWSGPRVTRMRSCRGLVFDFDMLPEDTKPYFRDVYFSRDFFDHCTNSSRAGRRKASCSACSRRVTLKLRFPHCELVLRASAEQQWPSK